MTKTINYKEICLSDKFKGKFQVSRFDTKRLETTYRNYFTSLRGAKECFYSLIDIESEKMSYQF